MTIKEWKEIVETTIEGFESVGEAMQNAAKGLLKMQLFQAIFGADTPEIQTDKKVIRSPKHSYHFPDKHQHRQIRPHSNYKAELKPQRNIPYQRRNY